MFDLNNVGDLSKAGKSIGGYFAQQAEEHRAEILFLASIASHFESLQKLFAARAASVELKVKALEQMAEDFNEAKKATDKLFLA